MSVDRKVLSVGNMSCTQLARSHTYKRAGNHYSKIQSDIRAEYERYLTLFCEACGESIEIVYSENFDSEWLP